LHKPILVFVFASIGASAPVLAKFVQNKRDQKIVELQNSVDFKDRWCKFRFWRDQLSSRSILYGVAKPNSNKMLSSWITTKPVKSVEGISIPKGSNIIVDKVFSIDEKHQAIAKIFVTQLRQTFFISLEKTALLPEEQSRLDAEMKLLQSAVFIKNEIDTLGDAASYLEISDYCNNLDSIK